MPGISLATTDISPLKMSPQICVKHCRDRGDTLAGLRSRQCYCGYTAASGEQT